MHQDTTPSTPAPETTAPADPRPVKRGGRWKVIVAGIAIGACGLGLFVTFGSGTPQIPTETVVAKVNECFTVNTNGRETRDCILAPIFAVIEASGPLAGIDVIDQLSTQPDFALYCHQVAHDIGALAYRLDKNVNKLMMEGRPGCAGGYYHGIVEEAGRQLSPETFIEQSSSMCTGLEEGERYRTCLHGIGHGVFLNRDEDISRSVASCTSIKAPELVEACLDGVFMAWTVHPTDRPPLGERYAFCDSAQDVNVQKNCLRNVLLGVDNGTLQSFGGVAEFQKRCAKYADQVLRSCLAGIGYAAVDLVDPSDVVRSGALLCAPFAPGDGGNESLRQECLRYAISQLVTSGRATPDQAVSMCKQIGVADVVRFCTAEIDAVLQSAKQFTLD